MRIFIRKWLVALVLVILGALIFYAVYNSFYLPTLADTAEKQKSIETYQRSIDELKLYLEKKSYYEQESARLNLEIEAALKGFPVEIKEEDQIMFAYDLGIALNMPVEYVNFGEEYSLYSMSNGYVLCVEIVTLPYETTYSGFKDMIKYITEDTKYPSSLITLSVSYDAENDLASGGLNIRRYYLTGQDAEYVPPVLTEEIIKGKENIFLSGSQSIADTSITP